MHGTLNLLYTLQLSVHARPEDAEAAEAKRYKGATVDIDYPVVPRTGEFFTVHPALEPLEVTRVTHWGPGFADSMWTEIHFSAPLEDIEILLTPREDIEEEWTPEQP